jgi:hypothetical protein
MAQNTKTAGETPPFSFFLRDPDSFFAQSIGSVEHSSTKRLDLDTLIYLAK